jgi:hypothetical protein
VLAAAPPAHAGSNRPLRLAGPYSLDVLPAQLAFSAGGETAVGYSVQNEDHPNQSQAYELLRTRTGKVLGPHRVHGLETLGVTLGASAPAVLTGISPSGKTCCAAAHLLTLDPDGAPKSDRTVTRGLAGTGAGALLAVGGGRLLSIVATPEGVWVEQTRTSGRPAPAHRITSAAAVPQTLTATNLGGGHTMVAWTAQTGQPALLPAQTIFVAEGSAKRAPHHARIAVEVPSGHTITELALGRGRTGGPTVAWIDAFDDAAGALHSQVEVADLDGHIHVHSFPLTGLVASDLSLATTSSGSQVLAWKACDRDANCGVETAVKDPRGRFGAAIRLGRADASQRPATAVSQNGTALVGWIDHGHVLAAARSRHARRFAATAVVSATNFAADLTIGFGAGNAALAAWTQGTLNQSVMGAAFKAS